MYYLKSVPSSKPFLKLLNIYKEGPKHIRKYRKPEGINKIKFELPHSRVHLRPVSSRGQENRQLQDP